MMPRRKSKRRIYEDTLQLFSKEFIPPTKICLTKVSKPFNAPLLEDKLKVVRLVSSRPGANQGIVTALLSLYLEVETYSTAELEADIYPYMP